MGELGQVRQEIDRKIQEKEEEFDNTRKNHQRAMDSLGASLEAEQRAKSEALRIKKKLESDINELEIALDHSNKANSEGLKAIKRYQGNLRDTIQSYEDETRSRQEVMEAVREKQMLSVVKWKSLGLFLTLLIALRGNWTVNLLMPEMLSMKCKSLTPRQCMRTET